MKILGEILWEMGRSEASAMACFTLIKADPRLTPAERDFLETRMVPEERRHAAVTRRWARKWAPPPREPRDGFGAEVARFTLAMPQLKPAARFAMVVAAAQWNERHALKVYDRYIPMFARISADMARDFQQIRDEEAGHVAFGRALVRRLEDDDPAMFRRISVVTGHLRGYLPTLITEAHAKPLKALELALA